MADYSFEVSGCWQFNYEIALIELVAIAKELEKEERYIKTGITPRWNRASIRGYLVSYTVVITCKPGMTCEMAYRLWRQEAQKELAQRFDRFFIS